MVGPTSDDAPKPLIMKISFGLTAPQPTLNIPVYAPKVGSTWALGLMYRFPTDLDLSPIVGEFTTQICVGQFDLQFSLGLFRFIVYSPIELLRDGCPIGSWDSVSWPPPAFYDLMNTAVVGVELLDERTLVLRFDNGLEARLVDDSDQYETMQIIVGANRDAVYII